MSQTSSGAAPSGQDPGPLAGISVLEWATALSGPVATTLLAAQGASVIKVETLGGDPIRRIGTSRNGMSAMFANANRGKRSIAVDLKSREGRHVMLQLIEQADVLVQNLRAGAAESLGLGPDEALARSPRLVYASINGYGSSTPRAKEPAYDHIIQAASGLAARQADPRANVPELVRHGIVDKATALATAQAICAALLRRATTGTGEAFEVSMIDCAVYFLWFDGMVNHMWGDEAPDMMPDVANSYRLTPTTDGQIVLNTVTDAQFTGLLAALDLDLADEFRTPEGRGRHGASVMREVRRRLGDMPTTEAITRLRAHDVPCAEVVGLEDVATARDVVATGVLQTHDHPLLGRITQPRSPARMDGTDAPMSGAPSLGQDTEEILLDLGYDGAHIARLRASGIIH